MGVSSIPSHKKRGERAGSDDRLDLLRSRAELRGSGMSRYIKRFGDPKEKTRPRVSHYTGRRRWRMQAEEFLCTPDKIFLFVIFPAMHVGMGRSKHQDMNGIVAFAAECYACSTR